MSGKVMRLFSLVVLLLALGLTGCDRDKRFFLARTPYFDGDMRTAGPIPMIDKVSFAEIDLAVLLDPEIGTVGRERSLFFLRRRARIRYEQQRLSGAFAAFYEEKNGIKERRNRVQDRIMAASNQRCARYKRYLKRFDSYNNLLFGSVTTAAAGLGAIFTPASTVAALSGAAAVSSGLRSEVNATLFQEKTIQVLTSGFEKHRKAIKKKITNYQACDIETYSVESAVGDAIKYHDACSLVTGLEVVAEDVQRAKDPGLKAMKAYAEDYKALTEAMKEAVEASENPSLTMNVMATPNKTEAASPAIKCPIDGGSENTSENDRS